MIIKRLELVNFQVISEFNADFEGNVYFITGDNELGKSTVLKAIGALLTGARDAVLKNGEIKVLREWLSEMMARSIRLNYVILNLIHAERFQ